MTRALVVDDAADLRFLMREVLSRSGVTVDEAASGLDALERLNGPEELDIVILDVQMPDMGGWDTLPALRREHGDDIGVILCTVRSQPSDAVRAYELGCDAYLAKPFDIRELAAATTTLAGLATGERRGPPAEGAGCRPRSHRMKGMNVHANRRPHP